VSGPSEWDVPETEAGERLDRYLAARFDVTRSQVQRWVRGGFVQVNGADSKSSLVLRGGEHVVCDPPPSSDRERIEPEEGALTIVHSDKEHIVVDKPAGLTVHPGAGRATGTLAHRLLHHFPELAGVGGPGRPGIVHRLDKDTSGVMVVARNDRSYRDLQTAFETRNVRKIYLAFGFGRVRESEGAIELPIGRHRHRRKEMTVRPDGRPSRTDYQVLGESRGVSLFALRLHTGRTHQIRVHLKAIRHPLVGDPVYGENRWREVPPKVRRILREFPRPALHAWQLGLPAASAGDASAIREFEAPPPSDLGALWEALADEPLEDRLRNQEIFATNSS